MKKFVVLYKSSVPAAQQMAATPPEQMKAGMALCMSWAQAAGKAVVDLGAPLGHPMKVLESSVGPCDSTIAGFSILEGESMKAVTDLLIKHPHHRAPGASIEVLEMMSMPGM
jgi:hypothetical protein